jgi:hypothetical protein
MKFFDNYLIGGFLIGSGLRLIYKEWRKDRQAEIWADADKEYFEKNPIKEDDYLKTTPGTRVEMKSDGTIEFTDPE